MSNDLLIASDVACGVISAITAYVHGQNKPEREFLYNTASSIAGRWISGWLNGGNLDSITNDMLSTTLKDHAVGLITRALICKWTREAKPWQKGWDFVIADVAGDELLRVLGYQDRSVLGTWFTGPNRPGPVLPPSPGMNAGGTANVASR